MADTRSTMGRRIDSLFDVRTIIGALLGIYGIVTFIVGLVGTSQAELDKADGWNVNLATGVALMVVSAGFLIWVRLSPTDMTEKAPMEETKDKPTGKVS